MSCPLHQSIAIALAVSNRIGDVDGDTYRRASSERVAYCQVWHGAMKQEAILLPPDGEAVKRLRESASKQSGDDKATDDVMLPPSVATLLEKGRTGSDHKCRGACLPDTVRLRCCGHMIHLGCMCAWAISQPADHPKTCPMCNKFLDLAPTGLPCFVPDSVDGKGLASFSAQ